jgi:hypothetical protein
VSTNTVPEENLSALRAELFNTLRAVKAGTLPLDQARAVNEIAKTLVDTAKVEVAYIAATGSGESGFIEPEPAPRLGNGITGVVRHRLQG